MVKKYTYDDVFDIMKEDRQKQAKIAQPTQTPQNNSAFRNPETWGNNPQLNAKYQGLTKGLYESEAQQKAVSDAEFAKSLRYLPEAFKAAGLYGSGQSQSMLADMHNEQLNRQNEITANTNQQVQSLRQQYETEKANLDEQAKTEIDEVANYISNIDWSQRTAQDLNNFTDYLKSGGFSQETIDMAFKQVGAFNPDIGNIITNLRGTNGSVIGKYAMSAEEQKIAEILDGVTLSNTGKTLGRGDNFYIKLPNGSKYYVEAHKAVDDNLQNVLTEELRKRGGSRKTGSLVFYEGNLYAYSGTDKGWREVGNRTNNRQAYTKLIDELYNS